MFKKNSGLYISIVLILTNLVPIHAIYSQSIKRQAITSYGSSAVISENITISQTAGQSYNTIANHTNGTISQGFQQPPAFTIEEIKINGSADLNVIVFPNPASYSITLTGTNVIGQSFMQVADISGKIFKTEKIAKLKEHKIDCATWANGIYFITIQDASKNSKSLRLIISK